MNKEVVFFKILKINLVQLKKEFFRFIWESKENNQSNLVILMKIKYISLKLIL